MKKNKFEVKKRKKPINKTRVAFLLFCVTLPIINWVVFYLYTNFSSVMMAFTDKDGVFTLDNFVRFYEETKNPNSYLIVGLKNTLLTFGLLLITFPFKVLVSYFIYKKIPFSGFYRIVFFLPSIIPGIVVTLAYSQMVGTTGFISQWVQSLVGLDYAPELLADSRFANIFVLVHLLWLSFPGDLIIWGGTFAKIPEEVLEAGRIDGVTWWSEFTKITVPLVWPTVSLQMVLTFCGIFGASGAVFLLTGGEYGTITISSWMYIMLYQGSGSQVGQSNVYNYMSAVGLVFTVIAVTLSLVIRKFADNAFEEVEY